MTWDDWVDEQTDRIKALGRWRTLRSLDGGGPEFTLDDGREVISFASNDYLGLSQHPTVKGAGRAALDRWGAGAGASRLIVGDRPIHRRLEAQLAEWRGAEAALVLASGYQANLAAITTFGGGARIVSDELNHASIIDAARLARAEVTVYQHGQVDHARRLVRSAPGRAVVVTDSVFSMDGDLAPVGELSQMCAEEGALLVLDDAHAVFDVGPTRPDLACLRVGTLSKTLGSQGGYITGPCTWIDLLVNRGRSFIFSTALTPVSAATALAAVEICRSPEGDALRSTLRSNVDVIRVGHPSPIIAVLLGDEAAAIAASEKLLASGLLVPAIRPPTVAPGTCRLRVAVSAAHHPEDLEHLARILSDIA